MACLPGGLAASKLKVNLDVSFRSTLSSTLPSQPSTGPTCQSHGTATLDAGLGIDDVVSLDNASVRLFSRTVGNTAGLDEGGFHICILAGAED